MHLDSIDASRLRAAFPSALAADTAIAIAAIPAATIPITEHTIGTVRMNGEPLAIPNRIYSPLRGETDLPGLSTRQRTIVGCVYSRHHSGYIREAAVRQIITSSEAFVAPFVIQLLGEYVVEIVQVIAGLPAALDPVRIQGFVLENPAFLALTRQRALSYWNCYFRHRWPDRAGYPALQVLDALKDSVRNGAARPLPDDR